MVSSGERSVSDPELVIGLTAAVGTPLDLVQHLLAEELTAYCYEFEVLHLSRYAERFVLDAAPPDAGAREANRIEAMMNLGNEARRITERNEILALAAIADLRVKRGDAARPLERHAFILRQLKHPEEVELLRRTYGDGFVLMGLYCPRRVREQYLASRGASKDEMEHARCRRPG